MLAILFCFLLQLSQSFPRFARLIKIITSCMLSLTLFNMSNTWCTFRVYKEQGKNLQNKWKHNHIAEVVSTFTENQNSRSTDKIEAWKFFSVTAVWIYCIIWMTNFFTPWCISWQCVAVAQTKPMVWVFEVRTTTFSLHGRIYHFPLSLNPFCSALLNVGRNGAQYSKLHISN